MERLHEAAEAGDLVTLRELLEVGADANFDVSGQTALHCAASRGRTDACALLIDYGANVNALTWYDQTPLEVAERNGQEATARFLRSRGGTRTPAEALP